MLGTKILLCVLVLTAHVATALFGMFVLMVGMNGFNDKAGSAGFGIYMLLQIIFIILSVVIAYFSFRYFQTSKQFAASSAFLSTAAIAVVGILIFTVISFIGGIAAASIVWNNR